MGIRFFIAYVVDYGDRVEYHNAQVEPSRRLTDIREIGRIEQILEQDRNYPQGSVTVISFQEMR